MEVKEPRWAKEDEWLIYADWLFDQEGESKREKRARAIARGIKETGGQLWLEYLYNNSNQFLSSCVCWTTRPDDVSNLARLWSYRWLEESKERGRKVEPAMFPISFKKRPDVIRSFWKKLAKIGKKAMKKDARCKPNHQRQQA